MKIGYRLILSFFFIAMIATGIIGYISYTQGKSSLEEESFNRLTAVRELKATQIESYFKLIKDQLRTFAEDRMVIAAMQNFNQGFNRIENDLNLSKIELEKVNQNLTHYFNQEYLKLLKLI